MPALIASWPDILALPQGKDSIRYLQEHEVLPDVYEAIGQFAVGPCTRNRFSFIIWPLLTHSSCFAGKKSEDNLFDLIDPTKVNKHLQELMPGLTIKVFRTYNASITLSRLLKETDEGLDVPGKKAQVRSIAWLWRRRYRLVRLPASAV